MLVNANRDYREILKEEFEVRVQKNPRYSLRAFARDLGVAPSRIIETLSYKRGLSRTVASRIVKSLGLTKQESEIFLNLVDAVHGRSQVVRSRALQSLNVARTSDYTTLQVDAFKLISDWYHYAILELTNVEGFQSDSDWISRRLGVPKTVIEAAIQRLKRLELLTEEDSQFRATEAMTFTSSGIPSDGLKKHHEQILEKAKKAVFCQSVEQRDLSAVTIAIRSSEIPRAKEMIKKFRRELTRELEAVPSKDSVYCLAVQFFQLDDSQAK